MTGTDIHLTAIATGTFRDARRCALAGVPPIPAHIFANGAGRVLDAAVAGDCSINRGTA